MNERIRQLAEQAGIYDFVFESMGIDDEMQMFTELLVQEVLTIINNPINYNQCVYTTFDADRAAGVAEALANKIKTHFKDSE